MKGMRVFGIMGWAVLSTVLMAPLAHAQRDLSLGYQSTMRSAGPSIRYPISEDVTIGGVVGALGSTTSAVVRGMLYFQDTEALDYYYYGQLGYWRYTNRFIIGSQSFESDSGVGIGVGVGLDYDLLEAVPEFIPLTISIEAGIGYVAWGDYSGFDLLTLGLGFHYRFGE